MENVYQSLFDKALVWANEIDICCNWNEYSY